jgi:hypothetical protein
MKATRLTFGEAYRVALTQIDNPQAGDSLSF